MESASFRAAFVDPCGAPIDFPAIGDTLTMTMEALRRIRKAEDFVDQLRACPADYSKSFTFNGEFDVYPILMFWHPDSEGWDLAQFDFFSLSFDDHGVPVERPPCTLLLCDDDGLVSEGVSNIVSGFWEIDDVCSVVARYDQRPLALIIGTSPGAPLSAAALTFAGAHFLLGLTGRPSSAGA